jgi:hypothetical protein
MNEDARHLHSIPALHGSAHSPSWISTQGVPDFMHFLPKESVSLSLLDWRAGVVVQDRLETS